MKLLSVLKCFLASKHSVTPWSTQSIQEKWTLSIKRKHKKLFSHWMLPAWHFLCLRKFNNTTNKTFWEPFHGSYINVNNLNRLHPSELGIWLHKYSRAFGDRHKKRYISNKQTYLRPCQTSMMELFCKNS